MIDGYLYSVNVILIYVIYLFVVHSSLKCSYIHLSCDAFHADKLVHDALYYKRHFHPNMDRDS